MKKIPLDKETRDVLKKQEVVRNLVESEGWGVVRELFLKKTAEMLNMANVNLAQPIGGNIATEISVKQLASARLLEILNDIQGTAEQFNTNSALTMQVEDSYVIRNDLSSIKPKRAY